MDAESVKDPTAPQGEILPDEGLEAADLDDVSGGSITPLPPLPPFPPYPG